MTAVGGPQMKVSALKETILYMLNGENCSALTMDVIRCVFAMRVSASTVLMAACCDRFCMPTEDNFQLKKLCYIFLERSVAMMP